MSTIIRSAIVVVALVAGATAASARPVHHDGQYQYSGSTSSAQQFWDAQQRNGS